MRRRLTTYAINTLGLALGFWLGTATTYAQTTAKIDADNKVCWDQPTSPGTPTLAALNAMRVRVTYDAGAPTETPFVCEGNSSPFTCVLKTSVPMAVQQGSSAHRIQVEGAALDTTDNTYGPWTKLVDSTVTFTAAPTPAPGLNPRIVKRVFLAAMAALITLAAWLGHV